MANNVILVVFLWINGMDKEYISGGNKHMMENGNMVLLMGLGYLILKIINPMREIFHKIRNMGKVSIDVQMGLSMMDHSRKIYIMVRECYGISMVHPITPDLLKMVENRA
jgi:hypothetical protein